MNTETMPADDYPADLKARFQAAWKRLDDLNERERRLMADLRWYRRHDQTEGKTDGR